MFDPPPTPGGGVGWLVPIEGHVRQVLVLQRSVEEGSGCPHFDCDVGVQRPVLLLNHSVGERVDAVLGHVVSGVRQAVKPGDTERHGLGWCANE